MKPPTAFMKAHSTGVDKILHEDNVNQINHFLAWHTMGTMSTQDDRPSSHLTYFDWLGEFAVASGYRTSFMVN